MDQAVASSPAASPPRDGGAKVRSLLQAGGAKGPTTAPALRRSCSIGSLVTGHEAPSWSRLLVLDHLDRASRLALYRTCTAARDWVLVTAEAAKARVVVTTPVSMARLRQVRANLQMRGKLRTSLVVKAGNPSMLAFALGVLEAGTTWLHELDLVATQAEDRLHSDILAAIDRCCPNLRALYLRVKRPPSELPDPGLFPKLEELCIWSDRMEMENLFRTATPYINRVRDLCLYPQRVEPAPAELAPLLFNPGTIITCLRSLHIPAVLNDALLSLLLECAPELEVLNVYRIRLQTDLHAQAQVRWQGLATHELHMSSLARLPVAPNLKISFNRSEKDPEAPGNHYGHPTVCCDIVGGEVTSSRRFTVYGTTDMTLIPARHMLAQDQPAALRVALSLVRTWRTHNDPAHPYFTLVGWTMSSELMLEMPRLPRFSRLRLQSLVWLPGPMVYSTLLCLVPNSFHTVLIIPDGLPPEQLESICLGAPTDRAAGLQIKVCGVPDQVQAIQHKIEQQRIPNVTVVSVLA